jgi:hypothetical protein
LAFEQSFFAAFAPAIKKIAKKVVMNAGSCGAKALARWTKQLCEEGALISRSGGALTMNTCTAQHLYEIQGPLYYNSNVTARIDKIKLIHEAPDRVRLEGAQGLLPPPTTKVGITTRGGWQAELHFFLTGLDN